MKPSRQPSQYWEERPTRIRATQITEHNYKELCRKLGCDRVIIEQAPNDLYSNTLYKFEKYDNETESYKVMHGFKENDYLLFTKPVSDLQVEIVQPEAFEAKYQQPTIHLSPEEYDDFQEMRNRYLRGIALEARKES